MQERGPGVALLLLYTSGGAAVVLEPGVIHYTDARCPNCGRVVLSVPGENRAVNVVTVDRGSRMGIGPVVACKRCSTLCEVIAQ
jgi:hypothetical protein